MKRWGLILFAGVFLSMCITAVPGCNDDDATKPKVLTVGDLAGTWEVTKYEVTHDTIPQMSLDFIQLGATITITAQATGLFSGTAVMVLPGDTEPTTIPFAGNFAVDDETITATFTPEIPPYFTSFSGPYEYDGNKITITDEDATFDFDGDEQEDPAVAVVVIEKM
jgi:hypothetical protein